MFQYQMFPYFKMCKYKTIFFHTSLLIFGEFMIFVFRNKWQFQQNLNFKYEFFFIILLVIFFYNRECCQKIKRSHIFNEWFLLTDLFESQLIFVSIFISCLFTKISPFDWRYGLKCPHLLCTKYVFLTSVDDGSSAVCLQLSADCLDSHSSMALAERFSCFHEKSFAFEVLLAESAIEALAMIIVVESLDPSVTSLDRKSARYTFGGEKFIPIFFAVG